MPPWSVSSPTRGSRRLWRTAAIDCLEPAAAPCRSIVLSELGIHTEAQPPYRRRNRREMVCQDDSNAGRRCSAAPAARRPTLSRVRNPLGQQPDQTTAAAGRRRLLRPPARPRSTCCFRSLTSNTLIAGAALFGSVRPRPRLHSGGAARDHRHHAVESLLANSQDFGTS